MKLLLLICALLLVGCEDSKRFQGAVDKDGGFWVLETSTGVIRRCEHKPQVLGYPACTTARSQDANYAKQ